MINNHHKQATLHDVARLAGVSHQTVSRVINRSENVSKRTLAKVSEAIEALDYRPNRTARSLITGQSQTIQVIDFTTAYVTPIPAMVRQSNAVGYRVGVTMVDAAQSRLEVRSLLDNLTSGQVDGYLLFDPQYEYSYSELERLCRGKPFVQLAGFQNPDVPSVFFDNERGMNQIMDHLLSLGHKKIAEIHGPLNFYDARVRHQTYVRKLQDAGLEPGPYLEGDYTSECGYTLTMRLLNSQVEFTALVCSNDLAALGALRALHERGLRVPEDISVTGYDDEKQVVYFEPPLTTVSQDYYAMSSLGLTLLLERIADPHASIRREIIPPGLVARQSSGPARPAA